MIVTWWGTIMVLSTRIKMASRPTKRMRANPKATSEALNTRSHQDTQGDDHVWAPYCTMLKYSKMAWR